MNGDSVAALAALLPHTGGTGRAARDNQQKRLYDAEHATPAHMGEVWGQRTIANADIQAWVDDVMARRAIQSRWGRRNNVQVVLKRGGSAFGYRNGARVDGYMHRITLPLFSRNPLVVLHEVAHCLTPLKYAAHGPEYAGIYLFLVQTVMGKEWADALRGEYRAHRVRRNAKAVPPPGAHPVVTKADVSARRRAAASKPVTAADARDMAALLRRAVKAGQLGAVGTKARDGALATARALDALAPSPAASAAARPRRTP